MNWISPSPSISHWENDTHSEACHLSSDDDQARQSHTIAHTLTLSPLARSLTYDYFLTTHQWNNNNNELSTQSSRNHTCAHTTSPMFHSDIVSHWTTANDKNQMAGTFNKLISRRMRKRIIRKQIPKRMLMLWESKIARLIEVAVSMLRGRSTVSFISGCSALARYDERILLFFSLLET